jgi:hypothetical protein
MQRATIVYASRLDAEWLASERGSNTASFLAWGLVQ